MEEDYDIVIGAPFIRLLADGTLVNRYGKIITPNKRGEITTFVGGKIRRVKRDLILRSIAERKDIASYFVKPSKCPPTRQKALRQYGALSRQISMISTAVMTQDRTMLIRWLYARLPCYIAHFNYLSIAPDEIRDTILNAIDRVIDLIMSNTVIVAPDRYVIRLVRQDLSERKDQIFKVKNLDHLIDFM